MPRILCTAFLFALCGLGAVSGATSTADPLLRGAVRKPAESGWIQVHLEGKPDVIGFQHGYLLAPEIEDNKRAIELSTTHEESVSWAELRSVAERLLVPKLPAEYREELTGMAAGLAARGVQLDLVDLVTMNAYMEFSYYYGHLKALKGDQPRHAPGEHCSAFVATGAYTRDGKVVMGHNNWTDYLTATRWNVIFDIVPAAGHRFVMDGMPGLIHSGDDFGVNDAGILITETTISDFHGFDENGVPEFVRARRAMQYAESIDEFARIMEEGNNGGYANTWLVADRKNNEIARLELGLKNVTLERTKDGYYVGSNFPINPKLIAEETTYPADSPTAPDAVRHRRWDQLMAENKGKIDLEAGKRFETDHYDVVTKEIDPNERTICGHNDRSSRGLPGWQEPFAPAGVAQAKVTDSELAGRLALVAGMGHPCGVEFHAHEHLQRYKQFAWQQQLLRDVKANPWVTFSALGASAPVATN